METIMAAIEGRNETFTNRAAMILRVTRMKWILSFGWMPVWHLAKLRNSCSPTSLQVRSYIWMERKMASHFPVSVPLILLVRSSTSVISARRMPGLPTKIVNIWNKALILMSVPSCKVWRSFGVRFFCYNSRAYSLPYGYLSAMKHFSWSKQ